MHSTKNSGNPCQQWVGVAAKSLAPGGEGSLRFVKRDLFCQSTTQRSHCKPTGGYLGGPAETREKRQNLDHRAIRGDVSRTHTHPVSTQSESDYCYAQLATGRQQPRYGDGRPPKPWDPLSTVEGSGYSSEAWLESLPTSFSLSGKVWQPTRVDYDMLLSGSSSEPALSGPGAVEPRFGLATAFLTAQGDRRGGCHAAII